jgi:hypothetical protein
VEIIDTIRLQYIHQNTFNSFNGVGAIIANNSYLIKNIKLYSLVERNPSRLIKYRFTSEKIKKLLKIKW